MKHRFLLSDTSLKASLLDKECAVLFVAAVKDIFISITSIKSFLIGI